MPLLSLVSSKIERRMKEECLRGRETGPTQLLGRKDKAHAKPTGIPCRCFPTGSSLSGFRYELGWIICTGFQVAMISGAFLCRSQHTACGMAGPTHAVLLSVLLWISPARAFHGSPAVPHLSHRRYSSSSPPGVFLLPKIAQKLFKKFKVTNIGSK